MGFRQQPLDLVRDIDQHLGVEPPLVHGQRILPLAFSSLGWRSGVRCRRHEARCQVENAGRGYVGRIAPHLLITELGQLERPGRIGAQIAAKARIVIVHQQRAVRPCYPVAQQVVGYWDVFFQVVGDDMPVGVPQWCATFLPGEHKADQGLDLQ